ncbi:unnamed protein product [Cuscuta epithymum]|uniref:Uncharacterized protein n=1 Tax=Cuscuta epithymum TaxID=186058 RepID=A0AAV0G621_9ASTE|nr:unnamed protein product [Cuscuta epithymum]
MDRPGPLKFWFLQDYQDASGQLVNKEKSSFVVGKHTSVGRTLHIENELKMKSAKLPIKYLGVPLHKGITRIAHCKELLENFDNKLSSWKMKMLSQGGRLILIKHVLNSIPLHVVSVTNIPVAVVNMINLMIANFFWGTRDNKPKYPWAKLKRLCKPTVNGGMGIRSITDIQKIHAMKVWWDFQKGQSIWTDLMQSRYGTRHLGEVKPTDSPSWRRICFIHEEAEVMVIRGPNSITWKHTKEGVFTTKSAYMALWQQGGQCII